MLGLKRHLFGISMLTLKYKWRTLHTFKERVGKHLNKRALGDYKMHGSHKVQEVSQPENNYSCSSLSVYFGCCSRKNMGLCDPLFGARELTLNTHVCCLQNAEGDRVCLQKLLSCNNKSMRRVLCWHCAGHSSVEQKVADVIITKILSK